MGGGCHAACFLRAYAGAPVTRTLRPSLLRCGERPCDTLRALPENTAHQPKHPATRQHTKPRQPTPPYTQNIQPPNNTLNRDSPPRPSSLGTGRTHGTTAYLPQPRRDRSIPRIPIHAEVHISSTAAPGIQARKTVSPVVTSGCPKRSEDGSPVGTRANTVFQASKPETKRIICTSSLKNCIYSGNAKIPPIPKNQRDLPKVRPLGLEPRTH